MKQDGRWIAKRMRVNALIDQVSKSYGGDDKEWLDEFKAQVIEKYSENLKFAYDCFAGLAPVHDTVLEKSCDESEISSLYTACCKLRKPFCKCGVKDNG